MTMSPTYHCARWSACSIRRFNIAPNNQLGDGVNVNDAPYRTEFPYLADAPSGRDRRHIDPGEAGCTAGGGPACAP